MNTSPRARTEESYELPEREYDRLLDEALTLQVRADRAAEAGHPEAVQHLASDAEDLLQRRVALLRRMDAPIGLAASEHLQGTEDVTRVFEGAAPNRKPASASALAAYEKTRGAAVSARGFRIHAERYKTFDERFDPFLNDRSRDLLVLEKDGVMYYVEHSPVPFTEGALFGDSRIRYLEAMRPTGFVKKNRWISVRVSLKPNEVLAEFDEGAWHRMCTNPEIQREIDELVALLA